MNNFKMNNTFIINILILTLGIAIGVIISNYINTVSDTYIDENKYQQQLDSLNILYGESSFILRVSKVTIDSLNTLVLENNKVLSIKIKKINSLESNRKQLKLENETLLNNTIKHINSNPTYLDSLRRKHFSGQFSSF